MNFYSDKITKVVMIDIIRLNLGIGGMLDGGCIDFIDYATTQQIVDAKKVILSVLDEPGFTESQKIDICMIISGMELRVPDEKFKNEILKYISSCNDEKIIQTLMKDNIYGKSFATWILLGEDNPIIKKYSHYQIMHCLDKYIEDSFKECKSESEQTSFKRNITYHCCDLIKYMSII